MSHNPFPGLRHNEGGGQFSPSPPYLRPSENPVYSTQLSGIGAPEVNFPEPLRQCTNHYTTDATFTAVLFKQYNICIMSYNETVGWLLCMFVASASHDHWPSSVALTVCNSYKRKTARLRSDDNHLYASREKPKPNGHGNRKYFNTPKDIWHKPSWTYAHLQNPVD